jgi:hypothetical protein
VLKASALYIAQTSSVGRFRDLSRADPHGIGHDRSRFPGALYVNIPLAFAGGFVYRHSTESLILAQDERWRRA